MPVPDFQSFTLPVLQGAADGAEHSAADFRESVASSLRLTADELAQKLPSGAQTVFANRIAWATVYLTRAGALSRTKRGVFQITERGKELLQKHPDRITIQTLSQFPEFVVFHKGNSTENGKAAAKAESTQTPEEQLAAAYQVLRDALANDVLETVRKTVPSFFEKLVVDLSWRWGTEDPLPTLAGPSVAVVMVASTERSRKTNSASMWCTFKPSAGRILLADPLFRRLRAVWRAFVHERGVFITTSTFTPDAMSYVQNIEKKIVLIDGEQLADLMIEHNVGVTPNPNVHPEEARFGLF